MSSLGLRLKKAREAAGYTQKELAEAMGWSIEAGQRRISYYEKQKGEPTYADLIKIALKLNVNPAHLAFGDAPERLPGSPTEDDRDSQAFADEVWIEHIVDGRDKLLRLPKSTLEAASVKPACVGWFNLTDNSMEPVMPAGCAVGVDKGSIEIHSGKCYAIEHGGLLRVKLVYELPKGAIRLRSYNEDEWPDEVVEGPDLDDFRVIGRVFWYSVTL